MLVVGHRGAPERAVENSLLSLQIALDQGASGVEFDVQITADGEPVLFHDDELPRLTGCSGKLGDQTWRQLRLLQQRTPGTEPQRITHLDSVLEWWLGRPGASQTAWLNLELKVPRGAKIPAIEALAHTVGRRIAALPIGHLVVSSFSRRALLSLAEAAPDVARGALIDDVPGGDWVALNQPVANPEISQVHPPWRHLSQTKLDAWQRLRWPVWAWTVNGEPAWDQLCQWAQMGLIAAAITDHPGQLARFAEKNLRAV